VSDDELTQRRLQRQAQEVYEESVKFDTLIVIGCQDDKPTSIAVWPPDAPTIANAPGVLIEAGEAMRRGDVAVVEGEGKP
jgi:hypothetical protein